MPKETYYPMGGGPFRIRTAQDSRDLRLTSGGLMTEIMLREGIFRFEQRCLADSLALFSLWHEHEVGEAKITKIWYDWKMKQICFCVIHHNFEPVPEGELPPDMTIRIEARRV